MEDLTGGQGGLIPDFGGGIDEVAMEVEPEVGSDYDSDHDDEACQRSRVIRAIDSQPDDGALVPLRAEELDMLVCFRLTPEFDLWTKFEQSSKCLRSS